MKLPGYLKKYFWDIDFEKLDMKTHWKDVLGRMLEYGDTRAIRWASRHFSENDIADILLHYRIVSPKSANFWALILGITKKKILCLRQPYLGIQKRHWPY